MKLFGRGVLFIGTSLLAATSGYTVDQLLSFLRSSIQLKQPDKEVAQTVSHMHLAQRLDERTIEQLQGEGLGPKTLAALKALSVETASLPAPVVAPPAPKPIPVPPPSYEDQQQVIRDITDYALNYTKRLPDFVCTQVTRRSASINSGDSFRLLDTIAARVAYVEGRENYEVKLINSTPILEKKSLESLSGSVSTGEFGSMMKEIFDPESEADIHWERWATLRGKRAYVFNYAIDQPHSRYSILDRDSGVRVVTAVKGLIFVDKVSNRIVRLTEDAVNIPPDFPVRETHTVLDYESQTIGTRDYLLPLKSTVSMRAARYLVRNEIEFRFYRKFGAEATIKFDEIPEPLPESKTTEEPPK